jgi:hypothetical protein
VGISLPEPRLPWVIRGNTIPGDDARGRISTGMIFITPRVAPEGYPREYHSRDGALRGGGMPFPESRLPRVICGNTIPVDVGPSGSIYENNSYHSRNRPPWKVTRGSTIPGMVPSKEGGILLPESCLPWVICGNTIPVDVGPSGSIRKSDLYHYSRNRPPWRVIRGSTIPGMAPSKGGEYYSRDHVSPPLGYLWEYHSRRCRPFGEYPQE